MLYLSCRQRQFEFTVSVRSSLKPSYDESTTFTNKIPRNYCTVYIYMSGLEGAFSYLVIHKICLHRLYVCTVRVAGGYPIKSGHTIPSAGIPGRFKKKLSS